MSPLGPGLVRTGYAGGLRDAVVLSAEVAGIFASLSSSYKRGSGDQIHGNTEAGGDGGHTLALYGWSGK